jgi:hypothetical protein
MNLLLNEFKQIKKELEQHQEMIQNAKNHTLTLVEEYNELVDKYNKLNDTSKEKYNKLDNKYKQQCDNYDMLILQERIRYLLSGGMKRVSELQPRERDAYHDQFITENDKYINTNDDDKYIINPRSVIIGDYNFSASSVNHIIQTYIFKDRKTYNNEYDNDAELLILKIINEKQYEVNNLSIWFSDNIEQIHLDTIKGINGLQKLTIRYFNGENKNLDFSGFSDLQFLSVSVRLINNDNINALKKIKYIGLEDYDNDTFERDDNDNIIDDSFIKLLNSLNNVIYVSGVLLDDYLAEQIYNYKLLQHVEYFENVPKILEPFVNVNIKKYGLEYMFNELNISNKNIIPII